MAVITGFAVGQHADSVVKPDANFDKLKTLVGEWEGKEFENGKEYPSRTDFRIVSGGSVLMNRLQPGTPDEMITMFHVDGDVALFRDNPAHIFEQNEEVHGICRGGDEIEIFVEAPSLFVFCMHG